MQKYNTTFLLHTFLSPHGTTHFHFFSCNKIFQRIKNVIASKVHAATMSVIVVLNTSNMCASVTKKKVRHTRMLTLHQVLLLKAAAL
jgi:hypothetical protein